MSLFQFENLHKCLGELVPLHLNTCEYVIGHGHYITLHYITLHYITLHYYRRQVLTTKVDPRTVRVI